MNRKTIIVGILVLLVLILSLISCKSKKNINIKPQPAWITSKPQSSLYYIGVSSSPKKNNSPADYTSAAQQKALADLSASISIKIESTSLLSIMETNYNINENFTKDINTTTTKELEGYELVDTWEDENYYWVYYRLLKEHYYSSYNQKKQKKIEEAKSKYQQANDFMNKQMIYNAFIFYADALSDLKSYFNEATITTINGEEKDLSNTIFVSIINLLNDISIIKDNEHTKVKRYVDIPIKDLSFTVCNKNKQILSNIPIKILFTGAGLIKSYEVSDNEGKIVCALNKITSTSNSESLSLSVDMIALTRTIKDYTIRNIIKSIPSNQMKYTIEIEKPKIKLVDNEQILSQPATSNIIKTSLINMLSKDFSIDNSNSTDAYDFALFYDFNTKENGKQYSEYQVISEAALELKDAKSNILYRKSYKNNVADLDYKKASLKAVNEFSKSIERSLYREMINSLNK